MRFKVERLAEALTSVVSSWAAVEAVTLAEHSEADILNPYFALVLDVYHRGAIPTVGERRAAYAAALGDPGAFETSPVLPKDRFFIDGMPLRVEYKAIEPIDQTIADGAEAVWVLKSSGTYMFYRLRLSRVLFRRTAWIEEARRALDSLPTEFWEALRGAFAAKMEHYLSDLGAAALRDDGFFYLESAAGFARYAAAILFVANRLFEPPHREIDSRLRQLKRIPDDFIGRWDTLMRVDSGVSRSQNYEVAELIAKSVLALR
jgi:hypothetical protein